MLWLYEVYFRLKHNKKKGWTSTEMEQTGREEGRGSKSAFLLLPLEVREMPQTILYLSRTQSQTLSRTKST